MTVLLLSIHPMQDQCLFHLHYIHMTDLPAYLPQASATLIKEVVRGMPPLLDSLITSELT